jgi:hypothetical protein
MLVIFALAALLFGGTVAASPVAPTSFDVVTGGPSHR